MFVGLRAPRQIVLPYSPFSARLPPPLFSVLPPSLSEVTPMLVLQSLLDVSGLSLSEDWVPAFTFFTTLSLGTSFFFAASRFVLGSKLG